MSYFYIQSQQMYINLHSHHRYNTLNTIAIVNVEPEESIDEPYQSVGIHPGSSAALHPWPFCKLTPVVKM